MHGMISCIKLRVFLQQSNYDKKFIAFLTKSWYILLCEFINDDYMSLLMMNVYSTFMQVSGLMAYLYLQYTKNIFVYTGSVYNENSIIIDLT